MQNLLQKSIEIAVEAHAGQYRTNGFNGVKMPYINHPFDVMRTIWRWELATEVMLAAAVLHDVLEDTSWDRHSMALSLSGAPSEARDRIVYLVEELTHYKDKETKEQYLESFLDPTKKSIESLVLKLADCICNVLDFASHPLSRDYAPKYCKKAAVLFQALTTRQDEFVAKFGKAQYDRVSMFCEGFRRLYNA